MRKSRSAHRVNQNTELVRLQDDRVGDPLGLCADLVTPPLRLFGLSV